jgi:signal transduction histidine kinase
MLGTVAHELRQPLSNIEAIAYYLSLVLPPGDAKLQAQLARIRELVEQSNWILSSGVRLAACAPSSPQPISLEELITEAVSFSGAAQASVVLELSGDLPLVLLDPRDGRDMVSSLLMLFRNMAAGGGVVTVTTSVRPEGGVNLEIEASGDCSQGVCGAGSELALESVRGIARAHGGTLTVEAGSPSGGIRGRLMLP